MGLWAIETEFVRPWKLRMPDPSPVTTRGRSVVASAANLEALVVGDGLA